MDRVPFATKVAYGVGAIAYGIKDNGFSVFLLLFYNQVVGLNAGVVGSVIAVALVFDALIDPMIGVLSDRTHTRWGRRHPWLYASALPIGLSWMLLWHPPEGSQGTILGWLLVTAVLTRAAIATNEVPSLAMAPEMTLDYHERTDVLRFRYLLGWAGGLAMLMLAYGVFLAPPVGALSGRNALGGYQLYGLTGAVAMALAVIISARGTHKRMAHPPAQRIAPQPARKLLGEMRQTLSHRAFLILMTAGIFGYTNQGVIFALSSYNLNFVWQFKTAALLVYALALFAGVVVSFFSVTHITRLLGKRRAAASLTILSALFFASTYSLRLAGLFPEPGSPALLPLFLLFNTLGSSLGIGGMIIGSSMMSDVVEASLEVTGRREEGLFFAGSLFMQKCASGLGILISGWIIAAAQFPAAARAGDVDAAVLDRLNWLFIGSTLALSTVAAWTFMRFPFGQPGHEARVAALAVAASKNA